MRAPLAFLLLLLTSSSPPAARPPDEPAHVPSAHARAGRTSTFLASLKRAHQPRWCISCHGTVDAGVACARCHASGTSARQRVRDDVCYGCHEFDWPQDGTAAQRTVSEWRASFAAVDGVGCTGCHVVHGPAPAALIEVDIERGVIALAGIGHSLPTGDPFRWLELRACADAACAGDVIATKRMRALTAPASAPRVEHHVELAAPSAAAWQIVVVTEEAGLPRSERVLGVFAR